MKKGVEKGKTNKTKPSTDSIFKLDSKDKYLDRWLSAKKESTRRLYELAIAKYLHFTGMTPEELIMEKWNDQQKKPIERTDRAEHRAFEFYGWMLEKYKKGDKWTKNGNKSLADKSATTYFGAIQSFYRSNGVPLNMKVIGQRGAFEATARKENISVKLSPEQVERMAYYAPTLRDKAVIWCMFQSGMDISTALSLDWGDISEELMKPPLTKVENKQIPSVMIKVKRKKLGRGYEYSTFITKTAIEILRKYLVERHGEDFANKMQYKDPLFVNEYGRNAGKRYPERSFRILLKEIAPVTDIANSRIKHADVNPLRSHALRASFSTRMKKVQCPEELVDYFMGHKLPYGGAYSDASDENLREEYCKYAEQALEPSEVTIDVQSAIMEQKATIDTLTKMYNDANAKFQKLEDWKTKAETEANDLLKRLEYMELLGRKDPVEFMKEMDQMKFVLSTMLKAPLGAIPNVKPPVDVKKLSEEEFDKFMKDEQDKFDKEFDEAMKIVEGWREKRWNELRNNSLEGVRT